jgi:hypothetical protein
MAQIPTKTAERVSNALKRFQPILQSARTRDINESDTSSIVADMLSEIFGYDKYSEVTREYAIRGTFCDLAIKIDNELQYLIEVKAIGIELKDSHVRQAIDYAAKEGAEWVLLSNGIVWRVFKVIFAQPIDHEIVLDVDLLSLSHRNSGHIETLYHLTREGLLKGALPAFHTQQEATNKFFLAALVLSDPVVDVLRRELRRLAPDVRIDSGNLRSALTNEVLKREVVDGEKATEARKKVQRAAAKLLRTKKPKEDKTGQSAEMKDSDSTINISETPQEAP